MIFVNEHLMFMNERLNMIGIVPRCIPCLYCTCHDRLFLCNWWLSNLVTRVNMDILYTLYSVCMYIYLIQGRDSCRIYANLIIKTIYYWQYDDLRSLLRQEYITAAWRIVSLSKHIGVIHSLRFETHLFIDSGLV